MLAATPLINKRYLLAGNTSSQCTTSRIGQATDIKINNGMALKRKAVILENFRSYCQPARVEIDEDLTGFVGKNDTGSRQT